MKTFFLVVLALVGLLGIGGGLWFYQLSLNVPDVVEGPPPEPKSKEIPRIVQVKTSEEKIDGFPKSIEIQAGDQHFSANYTGNVIRKKVVLILPVRTNNVASYVIDPKEGDADELADSLLVDGEPRALILKFAMRLPYTFIADDINTEIAETFTDVDVPRLRKNIDRFINKFSNGSQTGHLVYFVWMPGGRVYIGYETPNEVELIAEDVPFARALWRCYAGRQEPDRADLVKQYARKGTSEEAKAAVPAAQ